MALVPPCCNMSLVPPCSVHTCGRGLGVNQVIPCSVQTCGGALSANQVEYYDAMDACGDYVTLVVQPSHVSIAFTLWAIVVLYGRFTLLWKPIVIMYPWSFNHRIRV
jgi:hypothetical protein